MEILRYDKYNKNIDLAEEFLNSFRLKFDESKSDKKDFKNIIDGIFKDLKLNVNLSLTFGTGISLMIPIINNLIKNSNLSIELTDYNITLLSITCFFIIYLEHKKTKVENDPKIDKIKQDTKSLLTELKLKGFGNGIVKKLVKCFDVIKELFNIFLKSTGNIINSIIDMFSFTSILVPMLNAINSMVGKYELNLETFVGNFTSIAVGIGTLVAKHGIKYLYDKLKELLNLDYSDVFGDIKIKDDIYDPSLMYGDNKLDRKNKLIKGND